MSVSGNNPDLKPLHRIFLGELFAFIFFFAGAMSVLVGPLGVELRTAAITIGASVVLSAMLFLWLAFTTPTKKHEPRYEYMALSLLPAVLICSGLLGYSRLKNVGKRQTGTQTPIQSVYCEIRPAVPFTKLGPAQDVFRTEIAAVHEELRSMGFEEASSNKPTVRVYLRHRPDPVMVFVVSDCHTASDNAVYAFSVNVAIPIFGERNDSALRSLADVLKERWDRNMEKRRANDGKP